MKPFGQLMPSGLAPHGAITAGRPEALGATWTGDFIQYVTGLPFPPYAVPRSELDAALEAIRHRIRDGASWSRRQGMLDYLDEQIATMDTEDKLDALFSQDKQQGTPT